MSLDYSYKSLEGSFPRDLTPPGKRDNSPFGKTWTQVQELLEKELRMLNYRRGSVILQTAHSAYDVRKDGKLRSDVRRPEHPGVVLFFDVFDSIQKRFVQMSFECDQFTEWKANVRAIADALEALRKVNRYGVTGGGKEGAHYEGYKALPPPKSAHEQVLNSMRAMFIATHSNYKAEDILNDSATLKKAYKQAAAKLHPDNLATGNSEDFHNLRNHYENLQK